MIGKIQAVRQTESCGIDIQPVRAPLSSQKTGDCLSSFCPQGLWNQIKKPFIWIGNALQWLVSKIFPSWFSRKSEKEALLLNLKHVQTLKDQFNQKLPLLNKSSFKLWLEREFIPLEKDVFKLWWKGEFSALDPQVQTLFYQEYSKRMNHQNIAEKDIELLAKAFIIELGDLIIEGKIISPIDQMPSYLMAVEESLQTSASC